MKSQAGRALIFIYALGLISLFNNCSGAFQPASLATQTSSASTGGSAQNNPAGAAQNIANYPLEIIAPRAGLTIANRYYKAYPGLVYDVPVLGIGGAFPYSYSLSAGPAGMTIDAQTGEIIWPDPTEQLQPYPVTAQITDSAGRTAQVNWTITVTTNGFGFVDAVNGKTIAQGGTGTLQAPWKSIADWYSTKYDSTYAGYFLYFRNGTYRTSDAPIENNQRIALTGGYKPLVWMAYPGESAVIDTTGSYISIYGGNSNVYFQGLSIQNFTMNFGININSNGTDNVFYKNNFSGLPSNAGGIGTNASAIMISNGGSVGSYWAIVDNSFSKIYGIGYAILGYLSTKTLVQGNSFTDFTNNQSKAIGPKMSNSLWFIRDNRINLPAGQGIWVDTYDVYGPTKDIEISYNLVQVADGYTLWVGNEPVSYGRITSFRNTYIGAPVEIDNLQSSSGPVSFENDVIINSLPGITSSGLGLIQIANLLIGLPGAGIVDSSGNLTGSYANKVGVYGYQ